jgi:hypothetical protein
MVNDLSDFAKSLLNRSRNFRVFVVDDAGNLQRRLRVKALRSFILAFGCQVLEEGSRVRFSFLFSVGAGAFVRRRTR